MVKSNRVGVSGKIGRTWCIREGLRMWGVLPGLVERSKHVMEGMIVEAGYPTLWPGDPPRGFIASDVPTVAVMLRKLADVESKASTLRHQRKTGFKR